MKPSDISPDARAIIARLTERVEFLESQYNPEEETVSPSELLQQVKLETVYALIDLELPGAEFIAALDWAYEIIFSATMNS